MAKGRKRRGSDTGYRPSGSVRKKMRLDAPAPQPEVAAPPCAQSPALSDNDDIPVPTSSLPASPRFEDDEEAPPLPPSPLLQLSPLPLPALPQTPQHHSTVDNSPLKQLQLSKQQQTHLKQELLASSCGRGIHPKKEQATTISRWSLYKIKREDPISARVQGTKCGEKIVLKAYLSGIQFGSSSSDVGVPLDAIPYIDKKWTKLLAELARLWQHTGGPDATFSFPSSATFRTYSRERGINLDSHLQEEKAKAAKQEKINAAHSLFRQISKPKSQGGFGFKGINNPQIKANVTCWCQDSGAELASQIFKRAPSAFEDFVFSDSESMFTEKLRKEGEAIQKLLTRPQNMSMNELLASFSMDQLGKDLQECAPILWAGKAGQKKISIIGKGTEKLAPIMRYDFQNDQVPRAGVTVTGTIGCNYTVFLQVFLLVRVNQEGTRNYLVRSQKANNFQVIMGLFLLGSGAGKREIAVLAHAGLSVSASSINNHIKQLSQENLQIIQRVVKEFLCSVAWDNLNIAFQVESECFNSKNHSNSGTTSTLVVQHDPDTNAPAVPGTLPLDMKPPRTTHNPVIENHTSLLLPSGDDARALEVCLLWQLMEIALEHKPELAHLKESFPACQTVEQIALHITQHIDGTIKVINHILHILGVSEEDIERIGLLFTDGDLLTDSLVDKVESGRCNSTGVIESMKALVCWFGLFHAKMAGSCILNEHWGKPNSPWPGSLWWEHTNLLKRKPISAGWQSKKAAPWKPTHEFLQISLAGHVLDAFRIHCCHEDFDLWASHVSMEDFKAVAKRVYNSLFTSAAYEEQLDAAVPDTVLMINILYNHDVLYYWHLVKSIKAGDIGQVILVLRVWMTLGRVQRYLEQFQKLFLHNWLVNLTGKADGFKEVNLLQEHSNFWLKVVYGAKGVNCNWDWLAMISSTFEIPIYGTRHTTPEMIAEIQEIARNLQEGKIQEYILDCPGNKEVGHRRDLIGEGSKYANKRSAFAKYRPNKSILHNMGLQGDPEASAEGAAEEEEDEEELDYVPTKEDLAMDEDEPIEMADELLASAMAFFEDNN
ncbi:hypothetical protein BT96DRAFT_1073185 [Gymnopus androsaceus JB14]|uniref:DUF6589 domain-containing protein n=1 Tax=Gymnopus androsaceus JB14 TaxID=1447944 RepID=A0A6A4GS56_9AGAR|nr:hypothetical protein BT96DRAFT_1073185 [Gymnopus androsaceus JB14]